MKSVSDLGDLRGQAGADPLRPERAAGRRHDHRRRPDPGVAAHPQPAPRGRRQGHRARSPGPAEGRRSTRSTRSARRPSGSSRAARQPRSSWPTDVVGDSAEAIVAGLADGEVAMLENVRYEPGEESKDEAERGALADKYAALGDVFVSDGFGVVHRKQASVYDVAQRLPSAAGGLVKAEVEVLQAAHRGPGAPVRRGARRRQGVRQAGGDRQPDQDRRHPGDRRRDGLHLPGRPGLRGGQEPAGGGPDRRGQGLPERGRGRRQADRAAVRHRRGAGVQGRLPAHRGAGRRHPGRPDRPGHRSRVGAGVRLGASARPRRCSGTARWASRSGRASPAAPRPWPRR